MRARVVDVPLVGILRGLTMLETSRRRAVLAAMFLDPEVLVIHHELMQKHGVLVIKPDGPLQATDFGALAAVVDPYIQQRGQLKGLMIDAPSFPGWEDFAALLSHFRFVRDHHRQIRRVALVSDSALLAIGPKLASHFVQAQLRQFDAADRDAALAWLAEA